MAKAQKNKKQAVGTRWAPHQWLHETYFSRLPRRRAHRWLLLVMIFALAVVIAAQLAYPTDKGLPLASVNGKSVAFADYDDMAKVVNDQFAATKVTLAIDDDTSTTFVLSKSGAVANTEDMVRSLTNYPLWQRVVPGSIFWQSAQVTKASVYYDKTPLEAFADARSKELTFPPQNARLAIKNDSLTATAEKAGSTVEKADVEKALSASELTLGTTNVLRVKSVRTPPERTLEDLAEVRTQAEGALAHQVTITASNKIFSPSKKEIASWVLLTTSKKGDVTLSLDRAKVKKYLASIDKEVGVAPGQTNIELVDGYEAGRTTGATGRSINQDQIVNELAKRLFAAPVKVAVTAQFVETQPTVIYNSKYTATQKGLQAYINDVANQRNMHIVVQQLTGQKWYAAAREHESIPSGSTYKLYVSLVLFDRINKGMIHWGDSMLDTDVAECFNRMTVASTNPCAEAWIAQFGREYINNFVYARGFSTGTSFTTGSATQTTAADLNKYMIGLNNGTLVSGANRDRLLGNLSRHPYKYGIGTGSSVLATNIYDKVGFLWDYIHDTAIVPHPRGTYILTIMTKGQSYGAIASVTREIERIMYP